MKKFASWLLIAVSILALVLAGCGPKPAAPTEAPPTEAPPTEAPPTEAPPPAAEKLTFAWIPKALNNPVFEVGRDGALKKAEELTTAGPTEVEVLYVGSVASDAAEQARVVEDVIAKGVDAIGISCNDPTACEDPINKAVEAGIPVMAWDSDSPDSQRFTYLGVDNYEGGKAAADLLVRFMGEEGKVALLTGVPGAFNLEERIRGFQDGVADYAGIEIVATVYCNDDINLGVQVVEETMQAHPDLDGWFFVGLWPLFADRGSMPLWEDASLNKEMTNIVFDTLPVELEFLQDDYVHGLVGQKYWGWGYDTVQMIYDYIVQGTRYDDWTDSGMDIVTECNVDAMADMWATSDFTKPLPDAYECLAPAVAAPAPEEELNFIMVQHALCAWDSFWCTVEQGIADGAEDIGVNVTVLGPDEFNLEKTATLIDQAVAAQPDGIALTVTDPVLFKEPIMRALDAGIPVFAYNAGSGPIKDGIPYLAYLGQDEYQGGYLGGLRLAAEGGTKGVCINQQVGHTGLDARCQGFVDALDEKGIPAEVLAVGDDLAESQTIIDDYFTANPDVDIALTLGPNGTTPFYAFLDAAGLGPEDVTHGTFDLNDEIVAAIENGTSMFGIDQQPYLQGYGAVMWLAMVNRYGITPAMPVLATGPGFVDASNVGAAPDPDKAVNLMLVQHALCAWDSFWCVVEKGIQTAAEEMDVNVTVLGPDEFNLEKTATLIDQAVAAQPDGIGLTVTDPVLFKEPIMRALDAGIPVLAYNAGSGPIKDGIPYLTYLGQDEYQGGYQGGLRLAAKGGTSGVCINQQVGHTGLDARCQGFMDALDEKGIPAEVLAVGDDLAESQTIIDDYFTANPDVDIALTLGPNGATPFYAFLDAAGLGPDDVTHGTFDLNPEIVANIENGTSMFGIDQQPFLQGYGAVMMLTLLNRQNIVPALPVTATGPGFVDQSNVAIVKALAGEYR